MGGSLSEKVALRFVRRARGTAKGKRILDAVLADDATADWVAHRLGIRGSRKADPIDVLAAGKATGSFEDLTWLFTPTYAWRGVSELILDEAVYLYRLAKDRPGLRVAELGRYLGGTTFFLAAAGARVTSFDNDSLEAAFGRRGQQVEPYRLPLRRALDAAGLADHAELVTADVLVHEPEPASYDLVYLDLPLSPERIGEVFDRWWPSLAEGGRMILRDGREPRNAGATRFASELVAAGTHRIEDDPPGRFVIVLR